MPVGQGGSDIIRQVATQVLHFIKKKPSLVTQTCDGAILRLHYQWTFWSFMGIFSFVWYSWYHKEPLVCVNQYNPDAQVRMDLLNLCYSYLYHVDRHDGSSKTLMFYRWVPYSCLLIAGIFYLPRKILKMFDNVKCIHMINKVAARNNTLENDRETIEFASDFIEENQKTLNGLFYGYLGCNVLVLCLDVLCIYILNFLTQGRFFYYGFTSFYNREVQFFSDDMSRTFPPFAQCTITPRMVLILNRTEHYGCHLTYMEFYEKVFFIVWWWIVALMTITSFYIVFLAALRVAPIVRYIVLKVGKSDYHRHKKVSVRSLTTNVLKKCDIGDCYILYRLKQHVNASVFCDILTLLEDRMVQKPGKDQATENKLTYSQSQLSSD